MTDNVSADHLAQRSTLALLAAREYLLSLPGVTEGMLDRHLNDWRGRELKSLRAALENILKSSSNRQGMPNAIGEVSSLSRALCHFEPRALVEEFGGRWENVFDSIRALGLKRGRMVKSNSHNYWVQFSQTVVDAAAFLAPFNGIDEFTRLVDQFSVNEHTLAALPLLLWEEIHGLGFALACDFLKENGYPHYPKPDVHVKAVFHGLGLSESTDYYVVYKAVIRFAKSVGELPYVIDKIFWLVGSGKFYLDNHSVRTDREQFIRDTSAKLKDSQS